MTRTQRVISKDIRTKAQNEFNSRVHDAQIMHDVDGKTWDRLQSAVEMLRPYMTEKLQLVGDESASVLAVAKKRLIFNDAGRLLALQTVADGKVTNLDELGDFLNDAVAARLVTRKQADVILEDR